MTLRWYESDEKPLKLQKMRDITEFLTYALNILTHKTESLKCDILDIFIKDNERYYRILGIRLAKDDRCYRIVDICILKKIKHISESSKYTLKTIKGIT